MSGAFLASTRAPRLPRPALGGRHRSDGAGVESQRLHIVLATAELVAGVGYASTTVSAIARRAGVDVRTFYRLFTGKSAALAAVQELLFRQAMAASAAAYVHGSSWPEHLWCAARALITCARENPALVSVSLIDGQAGDPAAAERGADMARAFTVFLEEGFRDARRARVLRTPPWSSSPQPAMSSAVCRSATAATPGARMCSGSSASPASRPSWERAMLRTSWFAGWARPRASRYAWKRWALRRALSAERRGCERRRR